MVAEGCTDLTGGFHARAVDVGPEAGRDVLALPRRFRGHASMFTGCLPPIKQRSVKSSEPDVKCIRWDGMCVWGAYPRVVSVPNVYISGGGPAVSCDIRHTEPAEPRLAQITLLCKPGWLGKAWLAR